MASQLVNIEQVNIALDRVDGPTFEKFILAFYPAFAGEGFIPLGGIKDGGADAFLSRSIFEGSVPFYYYQISVQEDYRSKISLTIKRLHEVGRNPKVLIYITSKRVKQLDLEEVQLSEKLGTNIRIRDGSFIASNINYGISTQAAFDTYLSPQLGFLKKIGNSSFTIHTDITSSPAVYVFLRQELERRQGQGGLVNSLTDGLILWALEGTDPEQDLFLTQDLIIDKIEQAVPCARQIIRGSVPNRLQFLATRFTKNQRPIRWYRKQGKYCLSFAYRKNIEKENLEDEALRIGVKDIFETRIADKYHDRLNLEQRLKVVQLSFEALNLMYERKGIELAAFIQTNGADASNLTLEDHIEKCLLENGIEQPEMLLLEESILENLRCAFYESTEQERLFLSKLSSTYTLLFCLNTEPRIVEYFQHMASDFYLFVGSDILVQMLSETCLHLEDQKMTNTLNIIRDAGGQLILTEQVINEVYSHIEVTDWEFQNKYQPIENSINTVIGRNLDRILIRAYFYAKLLPPSGIISEPSWSHFLNRFVDYPILHNNEGKEQIRIFIQAKFNMEYITAQEISKLYDHDQAVKLAKKIQEDKKHSQLALNDAILTLAVYGRRQQQRESSRVSAFGYRTWWLTGEGKILKYTEEVIQTYNARYMIRPEFILNFITLAPSMAEIRRTYRTIFPSVLGIQLARRVDPSMLSDVLSKVREADSLDPARRQAVITQLSNQLKGDFYRKYVSNFD